MLISVKHLWSLLNTIYHYKTHIFLFNADQWAVGPGQHWTAGCRLMMIKARLVMINTYQQRDRLQSILNDIFLFNADLLEISLNECGIKWSTLTASDQHKTPLISKKRHKNCTVLISGYSCWSVQNTSDHCLTPFIIIKQTYLCSTLINERCHWSSSKSDDQHLSPRIT